MRINIKEGEEGAKQASIEDEIIVLIDVLRASSTIVTALNNGAQRIIPVPTTTQARSLKPITPNSLLCGERKGVKPTGFNLGNSPSEYTREIVHSKTLILTTSNFTRVLQHLIPPDNSVDTPSIDLLTASFLNINAATRKIQQLTKSTKKPLTILIAGNKRYPSPEDHSAANLLQTTLKGSLPKKNGQDYLKMLKDSPHGKFLIRNGLEKDLETCAQLNIIQLVPTYINGAFQV